jgi:hypothetical protein
VRQTGPGHPGRPYPRQPRRTLRRPRQLTGGGPAKGCSPLGLATSGTTAPSTRVEASNVAKIQPTSRDVRRRYRETLPGERQRRAFDELGRLIDGPRDDLPWHHRVGKLVLRLRPEEPRGAHWVRGLAEALGPSPEWLAKARRFADLYPSREDVAELEAMGVNWARLYFAFAVPDKRDRHALLRRAVRERWPDQQLRFTVQELYPSQRGGVGGWPRRPVTSHGPEVTLRELRRQCRRWLAFHEGAWRGVKGRDWVGFVRSWPREDLDDLLRLLSSADGALKEVAGACRAARAALVGLRRRAEQRRGRPPSERSPPRYSNTVVRLGPCPPDGSARNLGGARRHAAERAQGRPFARPGPGVAARPFRRGGRGGRRPGWQGGSAQRRAGVAAPLSGRPLAPRPREVDPTARVRDRGPPAARHRRLPASGGMPVRCDLSPVRRPCRP